MSGGRRAAVRGAFCVLAVCAMGATPESASETVVVADPSLPPDPDIDRIPRARIEREGARTAAEVLESQTSVHATTGSRGERIFSLRGFDQRQTAVLIDGAPAYIPYDGQLDLGMVPAELVDHVTVVKGPGSVVYGPNGLGGAVNLVTRLPGEGPLLEIVTESRNDSTYRLAGYHSMQAGRVAWQVFGGLDQASPWPLSQAYTPTGNQPGGNRLNSDARRVHGGGGLRVRVANGHDVRVGLLVLDGERGVPPSTRDLLPRYWRFTDWRVFGVSLAHEGTAGRLGMDEMVYARLYENLLDGYDDGTYATQASARAFHSRYRDQQFGGRARLRYGIDAARDVTIDVRLWAGAQHERHRDDPGPGMDTRTYSRTLVTAAPEVEAAFGRHWQALTGMQVDVEVPGDLPTNDAATRVGWGPLASVRWSPVGGLAVKVTAARRTRFASLKERFSEAQSFRKPNPALSPESAWHVGLDVSARPWRWLTLTAGGYDAEVADLIDRVALGQGIDQLQNVGHARMAGCEAGVELRPWRWLEARAAYSFLHARRTDSGVQHATLPYRPAHKATAQIAWIPAAWLELSSQVRVVGPRDYQDPETRAWSRLPTAATWDARLDLRPAAWLELWARVTNLLDSDVQSEYGFPDPGRQVWLGARFRIASAQPAPPGGEKE